MNVAILLKGSGLFLAALVLHLAVWRLADVKKEILVVVLIFLGLPSVALVATFMLGFGSFADTLAIGLLALSLGVFYVQTYPTLRTDIPTFRILLLLRRKGREGLEESEVVSAISPSQHMFVHKVVELENDRLAFRKNGRVYLTPAGLLLADLFMTYRRLLGLPTGAG